MNNLQEIKERLVKINKDIDLGYKRRGRCILLFKNELLPELMSELEFLELEHNYNKHIIEGKEDLTARHVMDDCFSKYGNDEPILLVIKNFNNVDSRQQYAFSKINNPEDTFLKTFLHNESILIFVVHNGERLNLKPGWLEVHEIGKEE